MSRIRISIRSIYLPNKAWISYGSPSSLFQKIFDFRANGTYLQTIEYWRELIAEMVHGSLKAEIQEMCPPPGYETIRFTGHSAKQIWRYVELLRDEKLLVIPFFSLQAEKTSKISETEQITHLLKMYPSCPIIVKSTLSIDEQFLDRGIKTIKEEHDKIQKQAKVSLLSLLTNPSNSFYYVAKDLDLIKSSGDIISFLKLKRTKHQSIPNDLIEMKHDFLSPQTPLFLLSTSRKKPQSFRNNIETVIDWYYAYRAILPWIRTHLSSSNNWDLSEFVFFYSLVEHVFNPSRYSSSDHAGVTGSRLLRSKPLRTTWELMHTLNPTAVAGWELLRELFVKSIRPSPLYFRKILDKNVEQYINDAITMWSFSTSSSETKHRVERRLSDFYPLLDCKHATIFALFLGIANTFIDGKFDNKFKEYLCQYSSKLEQQVSWEKRFLVSRKNHQQPLLEDLKHVGWVKTNVIRNFLCYEPDREQFFPYNHFRRIKTSEKCNPVLKGWKPNEDFNPVPGPLINLLVNMKLVERKTINKSVYLRVNIAHPYVEELLTKNNL